MAVSVHQRGKETMENMALRGRIWLWPFMLPWWRDVGKWPWLTRISEGTWSRRSCTLSWEEGRGRKLTCIEHHL